MIFTDQLQRQIELPHYPPRRIVSLVPSQTELLYDLGLDEEVVGITKFCVHPEAWFRSKTRVGGTKNIHLDRIRALAPDLIIGNKEENIKGKIERLAADYPVWISDVASLADALAMIRGLGELVGRRGEALELAESIEACFRALPVVPPARRRRVAYLIWNAPLMVAGGDTFIHHMLDQVGYVNAFGGRSRYPALSEAELKAAAPELIFLSSEPFPFREKHMQHFKGLCPEAVIILVDGEIFSWYGSRLVKAPAYFRTLRERVRQLVLSH
jgi:ABC-type Fe3+-hydroxamate transport system substrate-binding protein